MTTIVMKRLNPVAGRLIGAQTMHVPADFIVICLWSLTGLVVTALLGACVGSVDFVSILAAAG
jgi:hypothetical protein